MQTKKGKKHSTKDSPALAGRLSKWPDRSFPFIIFFYGFDTEDPVDIHSALAFLEALTKIWFGTQKYN